MLEYIILALILIDSVAITLILAHLYYTTKIMLARNQEWADGYKIGCHDGEVKERARWQDNLPCTH